MKPVPERLTAKETGERFYRTGKPCRNGHIGARYTSNGLCVACVASTHAKRVAAGIKAPDHPARAAARASGLTQYSTGGPCAQGHDAPRLVCNGICTTCSKQRTDGWKRANPGAEAAAARKRRAFDPSGHRKSARKWAKMNRSKVNESTKRCYARNPELWRKRRLAYVQNRKALQANNGGKFTADDIDAMHVKQNGRCVACGFSGKLTVDHVVAIINGGTSDPSNLQLLCRPCNQSKGRKNFEDWLKEAGHVIAP